jgi:hypothetical protein
MEQFKKMLVEAIDSTNEEFEAPSRQYSEHDIIFMMGYKQALQDMLEDFTEDYEKFLNDLIKQSLN